jgi:hypothetical protein
MLEKRFGDIGPASSRPYFAAPVTIVLCSKRDSSMKYLLPETSLIPTLRRLVLCGVVAIGFVAVEGENIGNPLAAGEINVSNPQNVLSPSDTVTTSPTGFIFGPASTIVDGMAADSTNDGPFIFADGISTNQFVSITGFDSQFQTIRIYTAPADTNRLADSITAYSSTTSTTSVVPASYSTNLGTFAQASFVYHPYDPADPFTPSSNPSVAGRGYFDLTVSAPIGTQSLLLDLTRANAAGLRVYEVQAINTTPEPASLVLLGLSGFGMLVATRRRRT